MKTHERLPKPLIIIRPYYSVHNQDVTFSTNKQSDNYANDDKNEFDLPVFR